MTVLPAKACTPIHCQDRNLGRLRIGGSEQLYRRVVQDAVSWPAVSRPTWQILRLLVDVDCELQSAHALGSVGFCALRAQRTCGEAHVLRCPNMIELLLEHIGVDLAEDAGQALQLSLLRRQGRLIGGGEGSEAQDREEGEFDQHFGTSLAAHAITTAHQAYILLSGF